MSTVLASPHDGPRRRMTWAYALLPIVLASSAGCRSRTTRDCRSLLEVDARLRQDARTNEDPKTPSELAQNWNDEASVRQSEHDRLSGLAFGDPRVAAWADRWRIELPLESRTARHLADAIRAGDRQSAAALEDEWNAQEKKRLDEARELAAYCAAN